MKANDFREHCRQVAYWVDWDKTVDQFMHGDPEAEVRGIAVTWLATNARLREAASLGLNFVISHEGAFYPHYVGTPSGDQHHAAKHALMDELGITLMRCHDTWDRMPEVGIPDAWATSLGFPTEPRPVESFYRVCLTGGRTVAEVAQMVLEKVRPLGQQFVGIVGDRDARVERMVVGTGAITRLGHMHELGADLVLATDDGISTTASGLWSLDLGVPMLIINHATAELPGMQALAGYIEQHFPGVPVRYLPCEFPYQVIVEV
ncbi:MAG: Nif3-like dinuclear metal center hexameric protein [Anaerolineae bacterium]|jgi:putative NIF3 family GTP cyclohydrolase 1 type 2